MSRPADADRAATLARLRQAWTACGRQRAGQALGPLLATAIRVLADGRPVAAQQLAEATGEDVDEVAALLRAAAAHGYEVDAAGRLVGAALTLIPTRHRLTVRGRTMYAWCGFDTLFLPVVLGGTFAVASRCPVTGTDVHLGVAPDGVERRIPDTTVVAIVTPGITPGCEAGVTGPGSVQCSGMPLLASSDAGRRWAEQHPGVAILDLDEAHELGRSYVEACGLAPA